MSRGSATPTIGGNLMKPDITVVVACAKEAWNIIPVEMVKKGCISNAMDGSEDNMLYEDKDGE